jgi:hypothetical protein
MPPVPIDATLSSLCDLICRHGATGYYELTAEQLNDDRLGRALERLEKHGPAVQVPLVLGVIKKFRLRGNSG